MFSMKKSATVSQSVSQNCISKNQKTKCLQHYTNNTSQFCTCIEMTGNKKATNINTITGKICVRRNAKSLSKQFKFIKTFALLAVASVHQVTAAVRTFSCKSQQWSMQGKRTSSCYSTLTLPPLPLNTFRSLRKANGVCQRVFHLTDQGHAAQIADAPKEKF